MSFIFICSAGGSSQKRKLIHYDFSNSANECKNYSNSGVFNTNGGDFDSKEFSFENEPLCIKGKKIKIWRKKVDSNCLVKKKFTSPIKITENDTCNCSAVDYECSPNNWLNLKGQCVPINGFDQPQNCRPGDSYFVPSSYQKISDSMCKDGIDLLKRVELKCLDLTAIKIKKVALTKLPSSAVVFAETGIFFFKNDDKIVYYSKDHGASIEKLSDKPVKDFYYEDKRPDRMIVLSFEDEHWIVEDHGKSIKSVKFPGTPNSLTNFPIYLHPSNDGIIYMTQSKCGLSACKFKGFYSRDFGKSWKEIDHYMHSCKWMSPVNGKVNSIACVGSETDQEVAMKSMALYYADEAGQSLVKVLDSVQDFIVAGSFSYAAKRLVSADSMLSLLASTDGKNYASISFEGQSTPKQNVINILN